MTATMTKKHSRKQEHKNKFHVQLWNETNNRYNMSGHMGMRENIYKRSSKLYYWWSGIKKGKRNNIVCVGPFTSACLSCFPFTVSFASPILYGLKECVAKAIKGKVIRSENTAWEGVGKVRQGRLFHYYVTITIVPYYPLSGMVKQPGAGSSSVVWWIEKHGMQP